jgi:signal transduction histidine kinase
MRRAPRVATGQAYGRVQHDSPDQSCVETHPWSAKCWERNPARGSKNPSDSGNEELREVLQLRPIHLTVVVGTLAGATTLLISGLTLVDFGYESSSLHVALETVIAAISIIAAHLVHGRFRQSQALSDLMLFYALAAIAVTNLLFAALPAALGKAYPDGFATWVPPAAAVVGSSLLLLAAVAPAMRVELTSLRNLDRLAATTILLAIAGASAGLIAGDRRPAAGPAFSAGHWSLDALRSHPDVFINILVALLLFAAGALFARRAEESGEELMTWLAAGSIVAGFARFNFFFFPTLYSNWISTGDVLRVAFYVLLFIGTAREISAYQERAAASAVLDERRRMARDLHDGLAQELAYISGQAKRLSSLTAEYADNHIQLEYLAAAAERALGESRRAIAALTLPMHEPLHVALAQEAEEVAMRIGLRLDLSLDPTIEVDPATRDTLVRIVREAVSNAGRHGHAGQISVELRNGEGLHLRVVDDGEGFDPVIPVTRGFGLVSMQERAKALGGEFRLASQPGRGTEIEIVIP